MGEGCGHLEKDVCIFFNDSAEYHIRTGHGRQIDRDECYEILQRCEDNGLVHEISNLDPPYGAAAICNCCGCSCFSLRIAQYFRTPDVIRSNYVAQVDPAKCVACGLCVENCNLGALKLGQKLCAHPTESPSTTPRTTSSSGSARRTTTWTTAPTAAWWLRAAPPPARPGAPRTSPSRAT